MVSYILHLTEHQDPDILAELHHRFPFFFVHFAFNLILDLNISFTIHLNPYLIITTLLTYQTLLTFHLTLNSILCQSCTHLL
jgi:hypothetical protein